MKQTKKHKAMKAKVKISNPNNVKMTVETIVWISAITLMTIIFSTTNSFGNTLNFAEETYIDDIPFETEMVVHELNLSNFDFADEAYINDIPFSTECVAANCNYKQAVSIEYEMEDETYINDIPFNTEKVTENYICSNAMMVQFQMEEEQYINDIPFNTESVVQNMNRDNSFELYANQN